MVGEGLEVVLTVLASDVAGTGAGAEESLRRARATSAELDRMERIVGRAGFGGTSGIGQPSGTGGGPAARSRAVAPPVDWEDLHSVARARLSALGVDPGSVSLDDLLAPGVAARIEREAQGAAGHRIRLDPYDLLFAAGVGVVATIVDFLVVKVPRPVRWRGRYRSGSWLTSALRDLGVDSDNWLARQAPVSFDAMATRRGRPIPGMAGRTHRVQTFGHDPLLGLVFGTLDIMRGTVTGAVPGAGVFVHRTSADRVPNPLVALGREVAHLLSDLPTRAGLPLPGWSVLTTIGTEIDGRGVDQWARLMYVRGYDTWHFLTMATSPATVELLVRAYWGLRTQVDPEYAGRVESERGASGPAVGGHPRFEALLLAAHTTAAAGNIAKVAAYGGNPLAVNYDQWLAFFGSAFESLARRRPPPGERMADALHANLGQLAGMPEWPRG